jgi:hypothetical protein
MERIMAKKTDGTDDGVADDVEAIAYVNMERDPAAYPAPHTAQVHPDEVQNYYSGGWVPVKEAE